VGIQFSTRIPGRDIYLSQVADASDLYVVGRLYEMSSRDGAIRYEACAVVGLQAIRNLDSLCISDDGARAGIRGCKYAPVIYRINVGVLALRRLVGSCPALIRARLSLLRLCGGIRWEISGGICLCAGDAQQG